MTRICSLLFLLVVGVASIMDAQDNGRVVDEPPLQIAVVGDVKSPGAINYSNDLTLISAINAAGGYTDFGLKTKAYLVRDGKVTLIYPGDALKDEKLDVHLKPWDTVYLVSQHLNRTNS